MQNYDNLLTDSDITKYQHMVPDYNRVVRQELGIMLAKNVPGHRAKVVLIAVLQSIADNYSKSEPTTKGGKVLRKILGLFSIVDISIFKKK